MRLRLSRRRTLLLTVVAILILLSGGALFYGIHHKSVVAATVAPLSPSQFQAQATTLTDLMKQRGINAAFSYTAQKITADPSFAKDCHPLLHELGHAAYAYYGGYAQAIQYQNELCDSGYTHGVLESYLGSGVNIAQALQTACSSDLSQFDQWQCYHGLGHGVMLVSLGNVQNSIALCSTLPSSFSQAACINGVFMQHFVVTAHNGTIPNTNPTSLHDCAVQPEAYKTDCYNYAPSAYLTVHNGQYASALQWCQAAELKYVSTCVGGVGSQAMKDNIGNTNIVKAVCDSAGKFASDCVSGAVGMYVYFHASSEAAAPLCRNQFKSYQSVCDKTIAIERSTLEI